MVRGSTTCTSRRARRALGALLAATGLAASLLALPASAGAQTAGESEPPAAVEAPEVGVSTTSGYEVQLAESPTPPAATAIDENSGAACSANSGRTVSGTLRGSDGRSVNALIGLVLQVGAGGAGVGLDGCEQGGYAATRSINPTVPAEGQGPGSAATFSFTNLPANVTHFWLEIYPKQPGGQTTREFYGGSLLRDQVLGGGRTGLNVTLPAACGHNGGNTGTIEVRAFRDGSPAPVSYVYAFSYPPMGPPGGGWGATGLQQPYPTTFRMEALRPGMGYHVIVEMPGLSDFNAYEVPVRPCQTTVLWVSRGSTRFRDVPVSNPFYADIEWMAVNEITTGFGDGTYRPLAIVTRQAMSAFMYRLAGEPAFSPPATASFSDVAASSPFFKEVEWLASEGISTGYEDDTFRPFGHVTRGAMSAFMYRLAGEPPFEPPAEPTFDDVGVDHPFNLEVEWMNDEQITTGYTDGTYRPGAGVSRQAMSAFMHRLEPLLDS
jgi:hypothetical protein